LPRAGISRVVGSMNSKRKKNINLVYKKMRKAAMLVLVPSYEGSR